MFPESKVTEIYCMADDFCKEFALQQEKYMIEDKHQHCLFAKKVIVKKLRKCVLGQCYKGYQTIVLSPRIILLPQQYMDSVILHEMAHLKFSHHRKTFWDFLTTLLGEDSISQKRRMDMLMKTFYSYSDFLLK